MRYTTGLFMLLLAVAVIGWALRHRRRVLALISEDALARYREAQAEDPKSISAFGEIVRPIVLFALVWIGVKSVAAYFWFDGPKHLSLFDLGALLALLACYGYCITIQTRYRMSVALAARDAADAIERVDAPTAAVNDAPLGRAA
jgi:hypothetical protein